MNTYTGFVPKKRIKKLHKVLDDAIIISMADISLTSKQKGWLDTKGGRDITDVKLDKNGMYIPMSNGNGQMIKLYLPKK